jgi:hypothetical protein
MPQDRSGNCESALKARLTESGLNSHQQELTGAFSTNAHRGELAMIAALLASSRYVGTAATVFALAVSRVESDDDNGQAGFLAHAERHCASN